MFAIPDRAQAITAACCMLHNFLRSKKSDAYCPEGFADSYGDDGQITDGSWRQNQPNLDLEIGRQHTGRPSTQAVEMRKHLTNFFVGNGAVNWQRSSTLLDWIIHVSSMSIQKFKTDKLIFF